MQEAKEAISNILHKDGRHDVNIGETVNEPVTQEQVHNQKKEHNTAAVDHEVHHTHHQTTVQPVTDQEVRPEKHHHNILPAEHKQHHHGKDHEVDQQLHQQHGQFKDTSEVLPTERHQGETKAAVGEHHHHHIHEHVQPVIQKETVQPHVVHNVVPVHEVVHKDPVVHDTTVNPAVSMEDFKKGGMSHGGHHHERHEYTGNPINIAQDGSVSGDAGAASRDPNTAGQSSSGVPSRMATGSDMASGRNTHSGQGSHHHRSHHHEGVGSGLDSGMIGAAAAHSGTGGGMSGHYGSDTVRDRDVGESGPEGSTRTATGSSGAGLGENIIGRNNPARSGHGNASANDDRMNVDPTAGHPHEMPKSMRDDEDNEQGSGHRSLLDRLTGK